MIFYVGGSLVTKENYLYLQFVFKLNCRGIGECLCVRVLVSRIPACVCVMCSPYSMNEVLSLTLSVRL
jgi:hypothetical protein